MPYRYIISLMCLASCAQMLGLDSMITTFKHRHLNHMSGMYNRNRKDIDIEDLAAYPASKPQMVKEKKVYVHVPQHIIDNIQQQTSHIDELAIRDMYYDQPSNAYGNPEYVRLRESIVAGPGPMTSETMKARHSMIRSGSNGTYIQPISDMQEGKKLLQKAGAVRVYDITRHRSRYETQVYDAALSVTIDHIGMPPKARSHVGLDPHTDLDLTRLKIGYNGNAHTHQQVQQRINTLASYLGITGYEASNGNTRDLVYSTLQRIQNSTQTRS